MQLIINNNSPNTPLGSKKRIKLININIYTEDRMFVLMIIQMISVLFIGLLAGIYLADRASAAARMKLDASSFIKYQQTVHKTYVRMMPPLVIGAVLGALGWIFMIGLHLQDIEFWLIAVSTCAILSVAIMTRTVNIPLNRKLMTWDAVTPPPDLKELWAPWEKVDSIRTKIALSAFVIEIFALCFKVSGI